MSIDRTTDQLKTFSFRAASLLLLLSGVWGAPSFTSQALAKENCAPQAKAYLQKLVQWATRPIQASQTFERTDGLLLRQKLETSEQVQSFLSTVKIQDLYQRRSLSLFRDFNHNTPAGSAIYTAKLEGEEQEVLVKILKSQDEPRVFLNQIKPRRNESPALIDAAYLKILSDLGLGPKFYGVRRVRVGLQHKQAFIMEKIEDAVWVREEVVKPLEKLKAMNIDLNDVETQLKRAAQELAHRGILIDDFQFLINPKGRIVIIDPELFSSPSLGSLSPEDLHKAVLKRNLSEIEHVLKHLRRNLGL